jgi:hypothetical protein
MPQFVMGDRDLKNLYDCIKGNGEVSDALLLLSKPQEEELTRYDVYTDFLILTLTESQLEEVITSIAEENESASIMVLLARNVKNGLAVRGEDDDEDDEGEFNPGDFGHPLNADGTPRQAHRIEGYCVSCTSPRTFDGFIVIAESGRSMVTGACPDCNTRINKILE